MRFKKIYIEITNSCNFDCSFCFKTTRATKYMSVPEFRLIVEKIRPFTNYIYLHVLGEPLLHPQLDELLRIAESTGLNINITTNGGLLKQKKEILLKHSIRQINISLHDAEENIDAENWEKYLDSTFDFASQAAEKTYICLRLWNTSNETSARFNRLCLEKIASSFSLSPEILKGNTNGNGIKLGNHIFLQRAPRFEWPDENRHQTQTLKTCYALRDHIAILADGQVVPCCLDADANMKLGNIFTDQLTDILETNKAKEIKRGFEQRKVIEPLCATCGFSVSAPDKSYE
ncbi:MAG: radical SAM protein [Bacteroidota bacterium]|nr:radical SAM protein [Bacteroidota bacterium]